MKPHEELEAKVTALLLGELSPDEAASLREAIGKDAELARLHDRLKQTIVLVREAAVSTVPDGRIAAEAPELSADRREQLLATFKKVQPRELQRPTRVSAPRRELFALAAMLAALLAVGALMLGSRAREDSQMPTSALTSYARRDGEEEAPVAQEFEKWKEEAVVKEMRPVKIPSSEPSPPPADPANNLSVSLQYAEPRGMVSYNIVADPAAAPKKVADLPPPSLPTTAGGVALALQTPPPAAQPPSVTDEFRNIPDRTARRSNIALPTVEDAVSAAIESDSKSQPAQTRFGEWQSDLATDFSKKDSFGRTLSDQNGAEGRSSGGVGGGRGRTPVATGTGSAEPQRHWNFSGGNYAGAEFAGVGGAGSGSAPVPGTLPLLSLQNPVSQFVATPTPNPKGVQLKDADLDGAVMVTNSVVVGARFADATSQLNDSFFVSGPRGFGGTRAQPLDRRDQPQFGVAPVDSLGSVSSTTPGVKGEADVNRFYSSSGVANNGSIGEQKLAVGDDVMKRDGKLTELSKDKKSGMTIGGTTLAFDVQAGKPVSGPQTEVGQKAADTVQTIKETESLEQRYREASARGEQAWAPPIKPEPSAPRPEAAPKSRVEIALPKVERGEVLEKLQVASGPVAAGEPAAVANRPAPTLGDVSLAVDESARRSLSRGLGEAESLDRLSDKQVLAEHDQPVGAVDREVAVPVDVARLSRDLEGLDYIRERLSTRISQEKADAAIPKTGIVKIIDKAEAGPEEKPTLLQRARGFFGSGSVERTARISVLKDVTDIQGLNSGTFSQFDPYWIQTEAEKIQSKMILHQVATNLDLAQSWANKHGGGKKLPPEETYKFLRKMIEVREDPKTQLLEIKVKSDSADEAATIANNVVQVYREARAKKWQDMSARGVEALSEEIAKADKQILVMREKLERRKQELALESDEAKRPALAPTAAIPQPEVSTTDNAFSTFSLNVSDVSFKLVAASLEKGQMPDPATVRSEEFINAFDYRDPEAKGSAPVAFAWERARYPFAHDRDLVRLSVKTAAAGRQPGRPLNLVLLLDNSGSMERADRLRIRQECLRVLAGQLRPEDRVSVVAFARTARLWIDGLAGAQAGELAQRVGGLTPEGGTNLEDAMNLAYQTALRHFQANGVNRVVLLTDGAANLGDVQPESLKKKVEGNRRQGIALDCFGLGWDGYNDDLLEVLSRNGDGRYGFINTPEAAASDFAGQLAGALKVAASDVKVQVEWNPRRVTAYRQIGYAKHQLKKEQFRDNTVDASEIGAAEAGNALYVVQVNPRGEGPLGTMRVRFKVPGTGDYREQEWPLAYDGAAKSLENSSPALRLTASASAFSEWLVSSPYAAEVTPDQLLGLLSGVPEQSPADPRPKKLEWMIRQAKSLSGK